VKESCDEKRFSSHLLQIPVASQAGQCLIDVYDHRRLRSRGLFSPKSRHLSSILVVLFSLYGFCHYAFHRLRLSGNPVAPVPNLSCGGLWSLSRDNFRHVPKRPYDKPLIWTVSGGPEYRADSKTIPEAMANNWLGSGLGYSTRQGNRDLRL
jgi:hypothetical protein